MASFELRHDNLEVDGVRIHYVTAGSGDPLVLMHGFPQTWYEWRHVIPALAEKYMVIAPDYRGAGTSARPPTGYDKHTMATDIRSVVRHLVGDTPIKLVGHDLGSFVTFAYASLFGEHVDKVVLVDAPLPGTALWDEIFMGQRLWHVRFHGKRDIPEMLITGREREYFDEFFSERSYLHDAAIEGMDEYVKRYSAPGALRAAFEVYRAIPGDTEVNRKQIASGKKLEMPLLMIGGSISSSGPRLGEMAREFATNSRNVVIDRCGHWIPEEQPEAFLRELTAFLES
jgi:pimeloyl-ACP methyl ester carboxylesterase